MKSYPVTLIPVFVLIFVISVWLVITLRNLIKTGIKSNEKVIDQAKKTDKDIAGIFISSLLVADLLDLLNDFDPFVTIFVSNGIEFAWLKKDKGNIGYVIKYPFYYLYITLTFAELNKLLKRYEIQIAGDGLMTLSSKILIAEVETNTAAVEKFQSKTKALTAFISSIHSDMLVSKSIID